MTSSARAGLLAYIASARLQDKAGSDHAYDMVNHIKPPTQAQAGAARLYGTGVDTPRAGLYRGVSMPTTPQVAKRPTQPHKPALCAVGHRIQATGMCGHNHPPKV